MELQLAIEQQCKKVFGDKVIYSNSFVDGKGICLMMTIDAETHAGAGAFYPVLHQGSLTVEQASGNALNLYYYADHRARIFYHGIVCIAADGSKGVLSSDEEDYSYPEDPVMDISIDSPEEVIECMEFILKFKAGEMAPEKYAVRCEEKDLSNWFEEPYVLVPEFSSKMYPLKLVQEKLNCYELPGLFSKVLSPERIKSKSLFKKEFDPTPEDLMESNKAMKALEDFKIIFEELAQPDYPECEYGDFLTDIRPNGLLIDHYMYKYIYKADCYLVLRPLKYVSYTALMDFFKSAEGRNLTKEFSASYIPSPRIRFIPSLKEQQYYVFGKKSKIQTCNTLLNKIMSRQKEFTCEQSYAFVNKIYEKLKAMEDDLKHPYNVS